MDSPITVGQFLRLCASPLQKEALASVAGHPPVIVMLEDKQTTLPLDALPQCAVIGFGSYQQAPAWADLVAQTEDELALLVNCISEYGTASTTLVQVLRHNHVTDIHNGLLAESLAYSSLQHSATFQQWLAERAPTSTPRQTDSPPPVLVSRDDDTLRITLNRPQVHNAFSDALKAELCAALQVACADTSVRAVQLRGNGPSFCAGGDLTEFGQARDAGIAHLSRTSRHAGALLAGLSCHSQVDLHGACIGAGIEVPAFAAHLRAHPDTVLRLPEVHMGLIPGAGGTVSILRRIGRQRTAYMAITNQSVNAQTALQWGLVDEIAGH